MRPAPVTTDLLHQLVTGSHAEGITALAVQAAICHHTKILLLAYDGIDFIDQGWDLPTAPVLPGQSLTDALHPLAAAIGLTIQDVTGYLGHHDHPADQYTRTFCFAVTLTDPDAICRSSIRGHHWVDIDDLANHAEQIIWHTEPAATDTHPPTRRTVAEPPLAGPLRAWAHGSYPDEAGIELLIDHATFLHRSDFTTGFVQQFITGGHEELARLDWPAAITALDAGDLPCSSAEERMLRLAASLSHGLPVDLRDATTGIDAHNANLLSRAILHAAGHRPTGSTRTQRPPR